MAIFVDLDDDDNEVVESQATFSNADTPTTSFASSHLESPSISFTNSPRPTPDLASLAAPYPVIYSIASNLDHNDLSNLANTCKQMRENMLQYRKNLLRSSLTCSTTLLAHKTSPGQTKALCVRDLVARCGTCGEPTCRNCVFKPGKLTDEHKKRLAGRIRRICKACQTAPEVLHPNQTLYKICTCASKLLWQCPTCHTFDDPLTTHKIFLTLLHHEKLQLLETFKCTHFRQPVRPPNTHRVWVEECPSPIHPARLHHPSLAHNSNGPITCAIESYPGGWACEDLNTGYIYTPTPESCIGATAEWWLRVKGDVNGDEGGFITYPVPANTESALPCILPSRPRWAKLAGKGLDTKGVIVRSGIRISERHGMLDLEREGKVRGLCAWCEGMVLTKEEERHCRGCKLTTD